jgi:hypothetical protein
MQSCCMKMSLGLARSSALGTWLWLAVQAQAGSASDAGLDLERSPVRAAGRGSPWLSLLDGRPLRTEILGSKEAARELQSGRTRPLALAAGDFDEDGAVDLLSSHAAEGGGLVLLQRGDPHALAPEEPERRLRLMRGELPEPPFAAAAQAFRLPEAARFLEAGDFDADGHLDVLAAAQGSDLLHHLAGDGRGHLRPVRPLRLPGRLTALRSGEVNRRDGLPDLAVAIVGPAGPELLVYESPEGALRAEPERFALPQPAADLLLGRLHEAGFRDVAVACGRELLIVQGRDRRTSLDARRRAEVPPALVRRQVLPFAVDAMALGDFLWDPEHRKELALLAQDGSLHVLDRRSQGPQQAAAQEGDWEVAQTLALGVEHSGSAGPAAPELLVPARVASGPAKELLVLDRAKGRVLVLWDETGTQRLQGHAPASARGRLAAVAALDVEQGPAAVLPLHLNLDALQDLVVLGRSTPSVSVSLSVPRSTFTVNSADNTYDAVCDATHCSFRDAVHAANANAGPDMIHFAIPGSGVPTISPTNSSQLETISSPVTIFGTTQSAGRVELNGSNVAGTANGLNITAGTSAVYGMVIRDFSSAAIRLSGGSGSLITANYLGTNAAGTAAAGNGTGVSVQGSSDNVIGGTLAGARNLISGNDAGVSIFNVGAEDNDVRGNYIGTDVTGTLDISGVQIGVSLGGGAQDNTIGGTSQGTGNLVSGNLVGVSLEGNARTNLIQGNLIGTKADGGSALPNIGGGRILSLCPSNTIGGTSAGARNVLSGNGIGFFIDGAGGGNLVQGNRIGTNSQGTAAVPNTTTGVWVRDTSNVTIGGAVVGARNVIAGNGGHGIHIEMEQVPGANSNVQVQGNYIGTTNGDTLLGNGADGIHIEDASSNTIGPAAGAVFNVIVGNADDGIEVSGASAQLNLVQGNHIGLSENGANDRGNLFKGVHINGATRTSVGCTDADPSDGNAIAGNGSDGIRIIGPTATLNTVRCNKIGTDATGTLDRGNTNNGVRIENASNNTIGGATAVERNIISGSDLDNGVLITGANASFNTVQGNTIGLDVTGTVDLGNADAGVHIDGGSSNTIGGLGPAAGNVISGNSRQGVLITGATALSNVVSYCLIGTAADGLADRGNTLEGIGIQAGAGNTRIGPGNTIAFNGTPANFKAGVIIAGGTGHDVFVDNSIHSNDFVGIDLSASIAGDGVTANDDGDADSGPNHLQNFPVLTGVHSDGTNTTFRGSVSSDAAGAEFRLVFYSNAACDASGYGEGETPLGSALVTTDGSGLASFDLTLFGTAVPLGRFGTATASGPGNDRSVSEFSACIEVTAPPPTATPSPTITPGGPTLSPTPTIPTLTPTMSITPGGPTLTPTMSITPGGPTLTPTATRTPSSVPDPTSATHGQAALLILLALAGLVHRGRTRRHP